MHDDEGLDILEFEDTPHGRVDFADAIGVFGAFFAFEDCEAKGHEEVSPSPEFEVAI